MFHSVTTVWGFTNHQIQSAKRELLVPYDTYIFVKDVNEYVYAWRAKYLK